MKRGKLVIHLSSACLFEKSFRVLLVSSLANNKNVGPNHGAKSCKTNSVPIQVYDAEAEGKSNQQSQVQG